MHPDKALLIPKAGYGYVYHIKALNRDYIGISTTPWSTRWRHHKSPSSGCHRLAGWLKYCKLHDMWLSLLVLFILQAKSLKLDNLLKKYIKKYASYNTLSGLNATPGGRDCYPHYKKKDKKSKTKKRTIKRYIIDITWLTI